MHPGTHSIRYGYGYGYGMATAGYPRTLFSRDTPRVMAANACPGTSHHV